MKIEIFSTFDQHLKQKLSNIFHVSHLRKICDFAKIPFEKKRRKRQKSVKKARKTRKKREKTRKSAKNAKRNAEKAWKSANQRSIKIEMTKFNLTN